jgi:hypothetical protein
MAAICLNRARDFLLAKRASLVLKRFALIKTNWDFPLSLWSAHVRVWHGLLCAPGLSFPAVPDELERGRTMQVFCTSTSDNPELRCSVCGQGFALIWERQSKAERAAALMGIVRTLRSHHARGSSPNAHPQHGFIVADSDGPKEFSGAAILGHAPTWAL